MAFTDLLATDIIQGVIDDIADVSTLPQNLLFAGRVPTVEADDGEVLARYNARIVAAEVIADDQRAVVRATRPIRLQRTDIPKIKHGVLINESMQNVLQRIQSGRSVRRDVTLFEDYVGRVLTDLVEGVRATTEVMLVGMMLDDYDYDKMGVKITGSWGKPSDLKITPATLWTDAANSTPITDILNLRNTLQVKYGVAVDRITLSTNAMNKIFATTEFRDKAALYSQLVAVTAANFPTSDRTVMRGLLSRVLDGMAVENYDAQVWFEGLDGAETSARYLPENKVILSSTQFDNNGRVWDFANAVVPETRPGMVPLMIGGGFGAERSGPVGYATAADPHGNPPGQILWGVQRGFPRLHKETATGVITAY